MYVYIHIYIYICDVWTRIKQLANGLVCFLQFSAGYVTRRAG